MGNRGNQPDLWDHLNHNRGRDNPPNTDLRDHLNGRKQLAYIPRQGAGVFINDNQPPQVQTSPPIDPVQESIEQLERAFRLLQNERSRERDEEFDEELESFAPHISNTPFPQGFRIPHVPPFDGNSDPYNHLSTFNTIM